MLVYRVQTRCNKGPYTALVCPVENTFCEIKHPLPQADGMDRGAISNQHLFGFTSISQLEAWFSDEDRNALSDANYAMYVYEVPDQCVLQGNSQCCFVYKRAVLKNVYGLEEKDENFYRLYANRYV